MMTTPASTSGMKPTQEPTAFRARRIWSDDTPAWRDTRVVELMRHPSASLVEHPALAKPELERRHAQDHQEQERGDGRGIADLQSAERCPIDDHDYGERGVTGATLRQHRGLGEHLEGSDDRHHR